MPTKHKRESVILTDNERETLRREAEKKRLSLSNLIRQKLGLPVLLPGAPVGNRNAARDR